MLDVRRIFVVTAWLPRRYERPRTLSISARLNASTIQSDMRVLRNGREAWLRIKSADRNSFLKKPQLQ